MFDRIKNRLKQTKAAGKLKQTSRYKNYRQLKRRRKLVSWSNKYLLPGRVFIEKQDVVITNRCNLLCKGCSHLMPYYKEPTHLDKDRVIASMRKLAEAADWFDHFNILGGEPFLHPDLKYILDAVPVEKSRLIQVLTNATIIPKDPELFEVMRRRRVHVAITPYPSNEKTRERLIEVLEREGVAWNYYMRQWTDYGEPCRYERSQYELKQQFIRCSEICNTLLDGKIYYCFRSAHTNDLGLCRCGAAEYVDILGNSTEKNREQLRRLVWRREPIAACQYCLMGTGQDVLIPRGR